MKTSDFIQKQWRASVRILIVSLLAIPLIIGINIWEEAGQGTPFNWMYIVYGAGFLLWAGLLYVFGHLVFKFVRAKALHDERRP